MQQWSVRRPVVAVQPNVVRVRKIRRLIALRIRIIKNLLRGIKVGIFYSPTYGRKMWGALQVAGSKLGTGDTAIGHVDDRIECKNRLGRIKIVMLCRNQIPVAGTVLELP